MFDQITAVKTKSSEMGCENYKIGTTEVLVYKNFDNIPSVGGQHGGKFEIDCC